ncbi:ethylene-responsive transcription factor 1-like [Phragmites australis]|uniref:ethylene-responsive transcription factor 1-like n=1 Tax=Phragmites australis TaxID=29695 RepID=UPI002D79C4FF|nr:ethylene-responsive transcription factor 1-like [Phragmites australis]
MGFTRRSIKNPAPGSKAQAAGSSALAAAAASSRKRGVKPVRSAPKGRFRGVYERQPGRWAAEFRSHRLKVRHWLGTFATEEEAKVAYDALEAQFLSLSYGGQPASSECGGDGGGVYKAPPHPSDEKQQIVLALTATTTTTTMVSSACAMAVTVSSTPSTPSISSLTSASPPTPSQNA